MVLSYLFQVDVPENATTLMTMILKLCSLEWIKTDSIFADIFDFRETEAFNMVKKEDGTKKSKYTESGYDNSIFFPLTGPIFFMSIAFAVISPLIMLVKYCTKKY